jgi:hypothetical protein
MKTFRLAGFDKISETEFRPGYLFLTRTDEGQFIDRDVGAPVTAKRYAMCDGVLAVSITNALACGSFEPNEGECERVGLPIT